MKESLKEHIKENAAHEKRFWIKVSHVCNNNCIFCLDADHWHNIEFEDITVLKKKISLALEQGYERLVISGGEPTIHPRFIDIVENAKESGFKKIQVITNGRMFSYKSFANAAVSAGLSEATFSIHGHTSQLHDKLCGIKGAYQQAKQGIVNLLNTFNCIINIDIVVNKLNYKYVEEIIKYFSKLHIYEYDLLYPVPFGNAFKNRKKLFFSKNELKPYLSGIFELTSNGNYYIWTNRFPPHLLEGFEAYIQAPYKLSDEVLGRRDLFEGYYNKKNMYCFPDHCDNCFIKGFCNKFLYYMHFIESRETPEYICINSANQDSFELLENNNNINLQLQLHGGPEKFESIFKKQLTGLRNPIRIILDNDEQVSNIHTHFEYQKKYQIEIKKISVPFLSVSLKNNFNYIIHLNHHNIQLIQNNPEHFKENINHFSWKIPAYGKLSSARVEYQDLLQIINEFRVNTVVNCPPCICEQGSFESNRHINLDFINTDYTLDIKKLIFDYIVNDYYVKSDRCTDCTASDSCRGVHINFARTFSFGILKPIL